MDGDYPHTEFLIVKSGRRALPTAVLEQIVDCGLELRRVRNDDRADLLRVEVLYRLAWPPSLPAWFLHSAPQSL